MNDPEAALGERLAADLERILGTGIVVQDVEITGEGRVLITVACLVDGRPWEFTAAGASSVDAIGQVIRLAAEARLRGAYWQMIGPA